MTMNCLTATRPNKDVYLTYPCIAFTGERAPREQDLIVRRDGTILVFDSVADHYTTCHAISETHQTRIREIAAGTYLYPFDVNGNPLD